MKDIEQQHDEMVRTLAKPGQDIISSLTPETADLLHMALGVGGEAGELEDAIKKHVIYNKPLDRENVVEELGDLEFYMRRIRQVVGITRQETLNHNITKLLKGKNARYKEGYSDKAAQDRADKKQEVVIIFNGAKFVFDEGRVMTYENFVRLAGYPSGTVLSITVSSRDKPAAGLLPGESVLLEGGLIVNAVGT